MQAFGRSTGAASGAEAQTERLSLCPNRVLSALCLAWHHVELLFACLSELLSALRDRHQAPAQVNTHNGLIIHTLRFMTRDNNEALMPK